MNREVDIRSSIYRVVEEIDGRPIRLGTAFFVEGGRFLTCRHVIKAHSSKPWKNGSVGVVDLSGNSYLDGGLGDPIHQLIWHPYHDEEFPQDFDIAVGQLPQGHPEPPRLGVEFGHLSPDQSGLTVFGFGEENDKSLGYRTHKFAGYDNEKGRFRLDGTCAPGFSGGPVLRNRVAIAVVCSDNLQRTVSYAIPLARIWRWLDHICPPQPGPPAGKVIDEVAQIAGYPLAGGLCNLGRGHDVIARRLAETVCSDQHIKGFLGKVEANLRDTVANEGLLPGLVIDFLDLSPGGPKARGQELIALALTKSRRTAAALILTGSNFHDELLDSDQREAVEEALMRLKEA
jgi:hypothetical protein